MNHINFFGRPSFPLSSDTLQMMQDMNTLAARLSDLGGKFYILSGCEETGSKVNAGYVVVAGELLPFEGGTKANTVYLSSEKRSVSALGVTYTDVYETRVVKFGLGDKQYNWADFKQVETNTELSARLNKLVADLEGLRGVPTGTIVTFGGPKNKIPSGWKICDGETLNRADHPALWEVIGSLHGTDGADTFKLPDLRGQFIAGWQDNDPDYKVIGKSTIGQKEITIKTEQIPEHNHVKEGGRFDKLMAPASAIDNTGTSANSDSNSPATEHRIIGMNDALWKESTIQKVGGGKAHENRPPFYVLVYIIKL